MILIKNSQSAYLIHLNDANIAALPSYVATTHVSIQKTLFAFMLQNLDSIPNVNPLPKKT